MMSLRNLINNFYFKYRDIIHFNKNILISAILTAALDVVVVTTSTQYLAKNYMLISLTSLVADFAIYNSLFIMLFYLDNKSKKNIKKDSLKLITTLGVSEIGYLITKFTFTYLSFISNTWPSFEISIITTLLGWLVYIITSNIMIKRTNLFN